MPTATKKPSPKRNAFCSFCRKSYNEVGPLVEGPSEVYICGECVELCQAIIIQERRRRSPPAPPIGPALLRKKLDQLVSGQDEAKQALVQAASLPEGRRTILLLGPSRSAKNFLARALAHALEVPFATGALRSLKTKHGSEVASPLLLSLLHASDFDLEAAQHGVVYLDGVDQPEVQEASLQAWQQQVVELAGQLRFDIRGVVFVCGGTFAELDEAVARSGRHLEQPVTTEALVAAGAGPQWVRHLAAIARAQPLDEETLTRMAAWIDFTRVDRELESASHSASRSMNATLGRTSGRFVRTKSSASSRVQACSNMRYATTTIPLRLTPARQCTKTVPPSRRCTSMNCTMRRSQTRSGAGAASRMGSH